MAGHEADTSNTLDRLEALAIDDALGLLEEDESQELQALRAELGLKSDESFELTAAFASLARPSDEELPTHLREKILRTGELRVRQKTGSERAAAPRSVLGPRSRSDRWFWIAAAAIAFALVGWWPALFGGSGLDLDAQRRALLERSVVQSEWTPTEDPAAEGLQGDVVWDNEGQQGYMRFVGLEPNDPAQSQYQLWIFDGARDERYPVDGGVFDIGREGEVLVPIVPAVGVVQPTLFAVTVEKPGGVVVSDRGRVVALARVGEG